MEVRRFHTAQKTIYTISGITLDVLVEKRSCVLAVPSTCNRETCLLSLQVTRISLLTEKKTVILYVRPAITVFTYLLTARSRVLLEKLTGFAAHQEIPRILWNPKVHYLLTSARYLSLS